MKLQLPGEVTTHIKITPWRRCDARGSRFLFKLTCSVCACVCMRCDRSTSSCVYVGGWVGVRACACAGPSHRTLSWAHQTSLCSPSRCRTPCRCRYTRRSCSGTFSDRRTLWLSETHNQTSSDIHFGTAGAILLRCNLQHWYNKKKKKSPDVNRV